MNHDRRNHRPYAADECASGSRGPARHYRALGAPRSHQSGGGRSRIIAAAISTGKELQNFHSSFAARE